MFLKALVSQDTEREFFGDAYRPGDFVFTYPDGRPPHHDSIRQRFERLTARAGLSRITFHDLRHTYATGALRAGVSPKIVSERIGHANIDFFLETYADVLDNDDSEAAEQAASFLLGDSWTDSDEAPANLPPHDITSRLYSMSKCWDVILLDEVERWLVSLDRDTMAAVAGAIDLLELEGPTLGRPIVDKVNGSTFHSMKELRPAGTSTRVLFIFDPARQAILLLGGDKAGSWKRWYDRNIPIADARFESWLATEHEGR